MQSAGKKCHSKNETFGICSLFEKTDDTLLRTSRSTVGLVLSPNIVWNFYLMQPQLHCCMLIISLSSQGWILCMVKCQFCLSNASPKTQLPTWIAELCFFAAMWTAWHADICSVCPRPAPTLCIMPASGHDIWTLWVPTLTEKTQEFNVHHPKMHLSAGRGWWALLRRCCSTVLKVISFIAAFSLQFSTASFSKQTACPALWHLLPWICSWFCWSV